MHLYRSFIWHQSNFLSYFPLNRFYNINRKPAFWYRVEMTRKENAGTKGLQRDSKTIFVFSQQPVFPPAVWQNLGKFKSSSSSTFLLLYDSGKKSKHCELLTDIDKLSSCIVFFLLRQLIFLILLRCFFYNFKSFVAKIQWTASK